jgi:hypothetical protein
MTRPTIFLLALALAAPAAHAQAVFRSVMPDGKVVYGDKPAPGAKESRRVDVSTPNIATPPQPGAVSVPTPQQQAADAADARVKAAQQELQAAKVALEAGSEPREGEHIGIAGGGTRLTDAYFQRIKSLEAAVAAAQKKLDDAYANRGSAR